MAETQNSNFRINNSISNYVEFSFVSFMPSCVVCAVVDVTFGKLNISKISYVNLLSDAYVKI